MLYIYIYSPRIFKGLYRTREREKERVIFNPNFSLISSLADLGDMFPDQCQICFIYTMSDMPFCLIKVIVYNAFIGLFDC